MLRVSGGQLRQYRVPITTLLLFASVTAYGQSLGEVARENREKKAESAATAPPKVISDSDLPKNAQGPEEPGAPSKAQAASPGKTGAGRAAAASPLDPRAMEQWRKQILAQKRTVATLEKRLARFQASLSSVDANAIARGEIFSRSQALEQERLAQVQEQIQQRLLQITPTDSEELKAAWRATAESRLAGLSATPASAAACPEQFLILVTCRDEKQQVELLNRLGGEGLECRALLS